MNRADFFSRFRDEQEIGREGDDLKLAVFYDDGDQVGVWAQNRRTTQGEGEILSPDDAATARSRYKPKSHVPPETRIRRALETAGRIMDRDGIQQLRGLAWTDNELAAIRDGLKSLDERGRGR